MIGLGLIERLGMNHQNESNDRRVTDKAREGNEDKREGQARPAVRFVIGNRVITYPPKKEGSENDR
jgi:hypothetical protein